MNQGRSGWQRLVGALPFAILVSAAAPAVRAAGTPAPAGSPAGSEDSPDKALNEAKEAFEAAQLLFVRAEYADAAERFLAAYQHKPFPAFLFNVAVSYEKAKQLEKAKEYFEKYLASDPNASDAAQVKLRLDVINKLLAPPPPPAAAAPASPSPPAAGAPPAGATPGTPPPGTLTPPVAGEAAPPTVIAPAPPMPPVLTEIQTKGLVVIDSKPQGATIYLNDKRSGAFAKTPWQGSLESKPVRLILESKGWKPEERSISPRSDKLIDVYIALSEEHYLGWVEVVSNVPGADVYVDRKDVGAVGRTPFSGHLKPGPHTVYLEKHGWDPVQQVIDVKPGTATQFAMNMTAAQKGWVSITGKGISGGKLFVDDKPVCATPCEADVTPGKHEIRVETPGKEDYQADMEIARGVQTSVDVQLSPRPPRTRAISTAIVALAFIGGGAVLGHLSQQTKDAINNDIKSGVLIDNNDSRFTRGKFEAAGADVLFGFGALIGAFAIWTVFEHGPESTGAIDHKTISYSPEVAPMLGLGGGQTVGGLSLSGRF
jgi:hypothetical protein